MKPFRNVSLSAIGAKDSSLVSRRTFNALIATALAGSGRLDVLQYATKNEHASGVSFLGPIGSFDHPFRVSGSTSGVRISPGLVYWPGSPNPVSPTVDGVSLFSGSAPLIAGSGLLCVRFRMQSEVDTRSYTSGLYGTVHHSDFTGDIETNDTPDIVFSESPDTPDPDFVGGSTTDGTYLVPIASVTDSGIVQLVFCCFVVILWGTNLMIKPF